MSSPRPRRSTCQLCYGEVAVAVQNEIRIVDDLRCAARLLIREIENPQSQLENVTDDICKVFEAGEVGLCTYAHLDSLFEAVAQTKRSRLDPAHDQFSLAELDWFSRNSYNLALKVCAVWAPEHSLRLVQACIKVDISLYNFR